MSDLREKVSEQIHNTAATYSDQTDAIMALFEPYEKLVEACLDQKPAPISINVSIALEPFQPKRPRLGTVYGSDSDNFAAWENTPEVNAALVAAGIIEK